MFALLDIAPGIPGAVFNRALLSGCKLCSLAPLLKVLQLKKKKRNQLESFALKRILKATGAQK